MEAKRVKLCLPGEADVAAAGTSSIQALCEEAICPICLEYFNDPVITECGHNFCRSCLTLCWGESEKEASCPNCRENIQERNIRPNRKLASFVEIAKKFSLPAPKVEEGKRKVCEKHQEPLKLFCKKDETPICVVCDRSKEHRDHEIIPVEEASQEYKDLISSHLKRLKKGKEKILAHKADTEKEGQDLFKQIEMEKQMTVAEFRQWHQFLEEQEKLLLARMEEVEKEIRKKVEEHLARLSGELSSLESLLRKMEETCQQSPSELLQGVRSILQRSEKKKTFGAPVAFLPELKWKIWDLSDIRPFLAGTMKQFKDAVLSGLKLQEVSKVLQDPFAPYGHVWDSPTCSEHTVRGTLTLDPDTAHPQLTLSEDHKSVAWGDKHQFLPDNEKRFKSAYCVLGCEGFTAGRYFWEVTVGKEEQWIIGVARQSVKRKDIVYSPEGGVWAVGRWGGKFRATNHVHFPPVSPNRDLTRIRVSLNCAGGQVAFYDANTGDHLYTFSEASFTGETLLPFFHVRGKGYLRISP